MIPKIGTQKDDYEDKTLGNSSFITCTSEYKLGRGVDRRVKIALSICSLIGSMQEGLYCSCSVVKLCLTLQSPWTEPCQVLLFSTDSRSLLKLRSIVYTEGVYTHYKI